MFEVIKGPQDFILRQCLHLRCTAARTGSAASVVARFAAVSCAVIPHATFRPASGYESGTRFAISLYR